MFGKNHKTPAALIALAIVLIITVAIESGHICTCTIVYYTDLHRSEKVCRYSVD
jgi:hypothetical protein